MAEKLRLFIFVLARNIFLQPMLNQYITGAPKGQQETSSKRKEAGPDSRFSQPGRRRGVMGSMRKWMLGAAMVAGVAAVGATTAQAAEFGVYVRGPVAYVPPCPGPGFVWTASYMANGYWVPGVWHFGGGRFVGPVVRFDHGFDRHFDRGHEHFRR